MRMAIDDQFLLRKVMLARSLGNASFQGTFHPIPCQIVCAFWKVSGK